MNYQQLLKAGLFLHIQDDPSLDNEYPAFLEDVAGSLHDGATRRSASSATTTSEHLTMADAPYQREAAPDAYLALANAMRDQSEDRTEPGFIVYYREAHDKYYAGWWVVRRQDLEEWDGPFRDPLQANALLDERNAQWAAGQWRE